MPRRRTPGPLETSEPGTIFTLRTRPLYADSPPETGRYGAFIIHAHMPDGGVGVGLLDGIWSQPPAWAAVEGLPLLRPSRWSHRGDRPDVFGFPPQSAQEDLEELTPVGRRELTEEEAKRAHPYLDTWPIGVVWSTPAAVWRSIEAEWRWHHDHDSYVEEFERERARREMQEEAARERYETRLKNLTWEVLLGEEPFERWEESPPFPGSAFRQAAVARVHECCRRLRDLGPRPRRAAVRAELQDLVAWFTEVDQAAGEVIETEEREDILDVLEELAHVARQRVLVDEFEDWIVDW